MAIKRIFTLKNSKDRTCLNCGYGFIITKMKDGEIITCKECGKQYYIDIKGNRCSMTDTNYPHLRNRGAITGEITELEKVKQELKATKQQAKEWENVAEDLARAVETLTDTKTR